MVEISDFEITIYDRKGYEIAKWVQDEWELEPEIVCSICNAIDIFYRKGDKYLISLMSA